MINLCKLKDVTITHRFILNILICLLGLSPSLTMAQTPLESQRAAQSFKEGQRLYSQGQYQKAIDAFLFAHKVRPHAFTLFNIARCYENLGQPQKALQTYRNALRLAKEEGTVKDLRARIKRLKRYPGRIFLNTNPPGATVSVDVEKEPRARRTPFVLNLAAGSHRLLIQKKGFELLAQYVEVEVGKDQTLQLDLSPVKAFKACPAVKQHSKCEDPRLLLFEGLHLHVILNGGFAVASELGAVGGPGIGVHATMGRIRIGAEYQYMPVNPSALAELGDTNQRNSFMQGGIHAGYVFPFGRFSLYSLVGAGLYLNRLVHADSISSNITQASETGGFIWTVGGGIEVMATSWMSLGIGIRLGLLHGSLLDAQKQDNDEILTHKVDGPFPYGTLWGALNFHL